MDLVQLALPYKPLIEALVALLSPIIAATVAFIAYQQWRTNTRRENRELRQAELSVYHRIKKFLRSVDETREIKLEMFEEFKEAVAEADFLFPAKLCEWLFDLEIEASCWVDGHQRVELWKAKEDDPKPEWVSKEEEYMEKKSTRYKRLIVSYLESSNRMSDVCNLIPLTSH